MTNTLKIIFRIIGDEGEKKKNRPKCACSIINSEFVLFSEITIDGQHNVSSSALQRQSEFCLV